MEKRIIELESKLSYQEGTIEDLNQVIIEQQKRIENLEKQVKSIQGSISNTEDTIGKIGEDEPPPHY